MSSGIKYENLDSEITHTLSPQVTRLLRTIETYAIIQISHTFREVEVRPPAQQGRGRHLLHREGEARGHHEDLRQPQDHPRHQVPHRGIAFGTQSFILYYVLNIHMYYS